MRTRPKNSGGGDKVLLSLILFFLAMLGIVTPDRQGDNLPWWRITLLGKPVVEGNSVPQFPIYDSQGKRMGLGSGKTRCLIFKTACSCDAIAVRAMIDAAYTRGEYPITIIQMPPSQIADFKRNHRFRGDVGAIRAEDLESLGLGRRLPVILRISASNIVLSRSYP